MEKSIETLWKEGFINSDALIAPKLNNLYSKKSEHIVDKFTRMFKINIIAIVVGSFLIMGMSLSVDIPYMGIGLFVLLNTLAFVNLKLMKGLSKIDKNTSSYQYLNTFDSWIKEMISYNQKFARVFYPLALLSVAAGFWFGSIGGDIPGDGLVKELAVLYPDIILVFGLPLYGLLAAILVIVLVAFSAGRIYKWDLNIVYGRVLNKLADILADMEDLRS
jgi:hypothetical protein